jgi:hypothetical protein
MSNRWLRSLCLGFITGLVVCLHPVSAVAQSTTPHWWFFSDRHYYDPLLAEPHAAQTRVLFPSWSSVFPHSVNDGNRFAWQVSMGREIPMFGRESSSSTALPEPRKLSFGFWVPISFHVIEDFVDTSNPIVDTDYRFGFMSKAVYGLSTSTWLAVRFVPWAHESTHLGDEYVILAQRLPDFERVNVSYEYYQYGVSLYHEFPAARLTLRHGGLNVWGDDGYYSNHLLGEEAQTITPSRKNYEPSFGGEIKFGRALGHEWFASLDARPKLAYVFHQQSPDDEQRHWSWSTAVGLAKPDTDRSVLRAFFLYWYHGVNPYGQLRSQSDHTAIGAGFLFQ